jgi:Sel1 repeat
MAAEKYDVLAIAVLAADAKNGYFMFDSGFHGGATGPEDLRRPPDLEEAFRLYREGDRIGDAFCCSCLGQCYLDGKGTSANLGAGLKWSKVAAEKGDIVGMRRCADCYFLSQGVDQSDEQAIYWLGKYLEVVVDDEVARDRLEFVCSRSTGGAP